MDKYVIWGSSGHAKVLGSIVSLIGGQVVALFDNDPRAVSVLNDVPLYVGLEEFIRWIDNNKDDIENIYGLVAIGGKRGNERLNILDLFKRYGVHLEPIIHPQSSVCLDVSFGVGFQVLAQAVVAADVRVGDGCIINHRASVDHECNLGNGVHLAPGATLCGCINVGDNVLIGANAVVLPRISIGNNVVVGAGSVVTRDIPDGLVVYGNPARL